MASTPSPQTATASPAGADTESESRSDGLGSAGRQWWPSAIASHGEREGRADPLDWIVGDKSRRFFIDAFLPDGSRPRLAVGGTVAFSWRECRSAIEVTIDPDGSYEPHASIPRDATHFWDVCDDGLVADSLEQLAMFYAEGLRSPARLRVRMCRWGQTPTVLRLQLAGGRPVLVPVNEAQRLAG